MGNAYKIDEENNITDGKEKIETMSNNFVEDYLNDEIDKIELGNKNSDATIEDYDFEDGQMSEASLETPEKNKQFFI